MFRNYCDLDFSHYLDNYVPCPITPTSLPCIPFIHVHSYYDEASSQQYRVSTAFQVYIQPESYSVRVADTEGSSSSMLHTNLLWHAPERTYIVHALLIRCYPMNDS